MSESVLLRKEGETEFEFVKRIIQGKLVDRTIDEDYTELSELLFGEGNKFNSSEVRKRCYGMKRLLEVLDSENLSKLPKNKLDEIREVIGELDIKKQEVRYKTTQLNKIKREFIKSVEISNDLKETIHNEIDSFPKFEYLPIKVSDNKLIVCLGDWHIGYVIKDYKGNIYNYEIAQKRLNILISEIEKTCNLYNITDITVVNLGDSIEHVSMRQNQSYECEFDLSQQIVKVTQLLFSFITKVSEFGNVNFYSLGGNHNRQNGLKEANLEGDSTNVVITEMLKSFIELSENQRIFIGDTDYKDDSAVFNVNRIKIKAIHGDNRVSDKKKLYDGEATMDNSRYDIILRGHDHNFNIMSQNNGYVITNGCLFGYNPYSVKKMSCSTNASQCLIVVGEDSIETIKNVDLQIN